MYRVRKAKAADDGGDQLEHLVLEFGLGIGSGLGSGLGIGLGIGSGVRSGSGLGSESVVRARARVTSSRTFFELHRTSRPPMSPASSAIPHASSDLPVSRSPGPTKDGPESRPGNA